MSHEIVRSSCATDENGRKGKSRRKSRYANLWAKRNTFVEIDEGSLSPEI